MKIHFFLLMLILMALAGCGNTVNLEDGAVDADVSINAEPTQEPTEKPEEEVATVVNPLPKPSPEAAVAPIELPEAPEEPSPEPLVTLVPTEAPTEAPLRAHKFRCWIDKPEFSMVFQGRYEEVSPGLINYTMKPSTFTGKTSYFGVNFSTNSEPMFAFGPQYFWDATNTPIEWGFSADSIVAADLTLNRVLHVMINVNAVTNEVRADISRHDGAVDAVVSMSETLQLVCD